MRTVILSLFIISLSKINAQQLETKTIMGEVFVYQSGEKLKAKDLKELLKTNELALQEYKKANTNKVFAYLLGFAGGALIGWSAGEAISGTEFNWAVAGAGAGLIGVSIPFIVASNKRTEKSVEIYNKDKTSFNSDLKIELGKNGIGVTLSF